LGAVPPFSFDERLNLLVDEHLACQPRIFFNAARLDRSLALDTRAWLDLAQPRIARVAK
jgi:Ala-tRNA(Pro) deacylase